MYRTMLVPLDGSKLAEVVFTYARELAGRLNIDLVFLHVSPSDETELLPMYRTYVEHCAQLVSQQSQEIQRKLGQNKKKVSARGEVVTGYPAEEILRYAEENSVDLIMLASHGRSGIRRWILGSVTEKVLRASKVPVWLVPADISEEVVYDQRSSRTILTPLDGSELAESVLPHVKIVASLRGPQEIEVVLLRVCEPETMSAVSYYLTPPSYPPATPLKWEDFLKEERVRCELEVRRYLTDVAQRLQKNGLHVRWEIVFGKPAEEILNYTSKTPHNLIVMATHGRSGLSKWAYGSVADKVLHGISTPVLLVRPR